MKIFFTLNLTIIDNKVIYDNIKDTSDISKMAPIIINDAQNRIQNKLTKEQFQTLDFGNNLKIGSFKIIYSDGGQLQIRSIKDNSGRLEINRDNILIRQRKPFNLQLRNNLILYP